MRIILIAYPLRRAGSRRLLLNRRVLITRLLPAGLLLAGLRSAPAQEVLPSPAAIAPVIAQYAAIVQASYEDTAAGALALQASIRKFTAQPSQAALEAARQAWLEAREWYGQTEAFRFYGGPIDGDDGPEGRLNGWPLDEAYIDGVADQPGSGLINDRSLPLTRELLMEANERGGEENISTGWHAIEFLLWGQDLSDDGPGKRSFTDYVDGKGSNAARRRQYLTLVADLLVDDLRALSQAWAPGRDNYRVEFEKGGSESLRKIIVGLGSLSRGELAGERLEVPAGTQDQEDEHSCFSDNTHRDVVSNALGISNVWHGRYRRRDGTTLEGASLRALVAAADPALAERTTRRIAASLEAAQAIQAPFDREIIGDDDAPGRRRVRKTIEHLVEQSKDLVDSAAALGIRRLTLKQP
jgi:putative iron-regulated protein